MQSVKLSGLLRVSVPTAPWLCSAPRSCVCTRYFYFSLHLSTKSSHFPWCPARLLPLGHELITWSSAIFSCSISVPFPFQFVLQGYQSLASQEKFLLSFTQISFHIQPISFQMTYPNKCHSLTKRDSRRSWGRGGENFSILLDGYIVKSLMQMQYYSLLFSPPFKFLFSIFLLTL